MNKMTKKDYFEVLRGLAVEAGNEGAAAFCVKEMERLANKKVAQTKTQKENEELVEVVYAALAGVGTPSTITDLQKANEDMAQYSNQKLSALMKKLVEAGRVAKVVDKKKSYFSVVAE